MIRVVVALPLTAVLAAGQFRASLLDLTGRWTVPQILIDGEPIGGYAELRELERRGLLDGLAA